MMIASSTNKQTTENTPLEYGYDDDEKRQFGIQLALVLKTKIWLLLRLLFCKNGKDLFLFPNTRYICDFTVAVVRK